jgi:hypothetical protein
MKMGLSLSHNPEVIAGLSSKSILLAARHVSCLWLYWPHEGLAACEFHMEILSYVLELSCVLIMLLRWIVGKDVLWISWGFSSMPAQHGECLPVL